MRFHTTPAACNTVVLLAIEVRAAWHLGSDGVSDSRSDVRGADPRLAASLRLDRI